jgi:YbbR domain-containing protein
VFGSREAIEHIDYILTDSICITELREEVQLNVTLQTPAQVRVSPKTVQVTWKAEPFTEKSFVLPIEVLGVPDGKRVRLFPQQANVTVRVGISHFAHVQEADIKAVCHYPSQPCHALPIELKTDNPYISNIRISPSSVEYIIMN